jgi:hypothetical protein
MRISEYLENHGDSPHLPGIAGKINGFPARREIEIKNHVPKPVYKI